MGLTHLGIIADGNRRWAKSQGLPTIEGYKRGLDTIKLLVNAADKAGIRYITFYVFSTENWERSADEVSYIMKLAESRILKYAEELLENNARMLILGSRDRVGAGLNKSLDKAEEITKDCTGITVCFCFNYGGEKEIADAANAAMASSEEITPETIRSHLYHPEVPDIDMVVRTSGEERISGFMLWRSSYAEFMFIKKYFPEMSEEDMEGIVEEYDKRNRRFGK
ncbi:di-trans,poly-cis-decaprenylcistransferase [Candidatus Saccharibacteria bacterium]|nr:di-trans,poly-cis-decaprenylcistransferase [Candidatus Saccharibacteria bacterium]